MSVLPMNILNNIIYCIICFEPAYCQLHLTHPLFLLIEKAKILSLSILFTCDFKTFIAVLKKCQGGAVNKVTEEESIAPVLEIYFLVLPIHHQFAHYLWQMLKLLLHRSPSKILGNWKLR